MDGTTNTGRLYGGVKSFACPNCGGIVDVRAPGQTLSAGCTHCGTLIDITDDNFRILQEYHLKMKSPLIPLGSRGKLDGITWEVIGYMTRKSALWDFYWDEYLLFNPIHGFHWLTNAYGHWTLVEGMMEKPTYSSDGKTIQFNNKSYKRFSGGEAVIQYVIGEFYWFAEIGDTVKVYDFISPPEVISAEIENGGLFWSKGRHIEAEEVKEAFKVEKPMPSPKGVGPVQPNNPKKKAKQLLVPYLILLAALILLQVLFSTTAQNKEVYQSYFSLDKKDSTVVVDNLHLAGGSTNLFGEISAPQILNNWVEADLLLFNLNTQQEYMVPLTVQYYAGYDGGENWSEGSRYNSTIANRIPGGDYRMEISISTDSTSLETFGPENINISLIRDTTFANNFIFAFILITILPLFFWIRSYSWEKRRWKDAD